MTHRDIIVEWEDIGEGLAGDYNPDDPHDVPLLRFTIQGGPFDGLSYCTDIAVGAPQALLDHVAMAIKSCATRREIEALTWRHWRRHSASPKFQDCFTKGADLIIAAIDRRRESAQGTTGIRDVVSGIIAKEMRESPLVQSLRHIARIGGNLDDGALTTATGPNDARQRGLMYTEARRVAMEVLAGLGLPEPEQE